MNILQYRDYIARIAYDPDMDRFMGRVINARDSITFYGKSTAELRREFKRSVADYLAYCREQGLEPARPFSGQFRLRLPAELHARLSTLAAVNNESLNSLIVKTLADHVEGASA